MRIRFTALVVVKHAGQTVSTDELTRTVWHGRAMSDQPIYQGIAQLRKALDDEARHPKYIITVTKKGYRLIAKVRRPESLHRSTFVQTHRYRPALAIMLAAS